MTMPAATTNTTTAEALGEIMLETQTALEMAVNFRARLDRALRERTPELFRKQIRSVRHDLGNQMQVLQLAHDVAKEHRDKLKRHK
jgi:hypothetical protein